MLNSLNEKREQHLERFNNIEKSENIESPQINDLEPPSFGQKPLSNEEDLDVTDIDEFI